MNDQASHASTATSAATSATNAASSTTFAPDQRADQTADGQGAQGQRVYEQSGCYPAEGKPFRLWALLGWLTLVIVSLAVVAALLNIYFVGSPWQAA